eukprot:symbB.v1.2.014017.t1/scaffold992.1/size262058/3
MVQSQCCEAKAVMKAKYMAQREDQQHSGSDTSLEVSKVKVALIFIGQLRALHTDVVLKHLEDELIKPLSPDIFMIASTNRTWLEEMKSIGSGVGHLGDFHILGTEEILERLKPVDVHFYSGTEHVAVPRSPTCGSPRKIYAQFWPFSFASSMILNAEQRTGQRYDWILRARPDVTLMGRPLRLPPMETFTPAMVFGQAYYHGCLLCDQFFLLTRNAMEAVFTVEDSFRRCEEVLHASAEPCWCCNGQCHRQVRCGTGRNMIGGDTECTIMRHLNQRKVVINANQTFLLQTHRLHLVEATWFRARHLTMTPGRICPWE